MSVRADAVRRAAQVRAERATRIAAREERIGSCLAEYFAATARGEQVTAAARLRCEEIMAQSRAAVQQCHDRAATAVRELEGLGLNRADVAEMTGLGLREVRQLLTSARAAVSGVAASGAAGVTDTDRETRTLAFPTPSLDASATVTIMSAMPAAEPSPTGLSPTRAS